MRIEGCKLIGRIGDEYVFANSVFRHNDDFQGVTGFTVVPVSEEWLEELLSIDNLMDRYEDCYREQFGNTCPCHHCCENCGHVTGHDGESGCEECKVPSLREYCGQIAQYDGASAVVDESYSSHAEPALRKLGLEFETTDCTGGGRIFGGNFFDRLDEVYDHDALIAILRVEDKHTSAEDGAKIIFA